MSKEQLNTTTDMDEYEYDLEWEIKSYIKEINTGNARLALIIGNMGSNFSSKFSKLVADLLSDYLKREA